MTKQTFEEYLEQMCEKSGSLDGVLDDDMPDKVDSWIAELDIQEVIDFAQKWGEEIKLESMKRGLETGSEIANSVFKAKLKN